MTVLTTAINSMNSRFIIINLHQNNNQRANEYFTSALYANTAFALVMIIPVILFISNLDIINVSPRLMKDAQITCSVIFLSYFIGLVSSYSGIVLYAKNILWKGSMRTAESNILRIVILFSLFYLFSPKVYFVVIATFIASLYPLIFNLYYTHKYLPQLEIKRKYFSIKRNIEVASSGIWNSLTKLSHLLLDGLDLLLCNLYISGVMTGNVSIAKTIPAIYTGLVAMLSDSFYPKFLEYYSKGEQKQLLDEIKKSICILSGISGICLSMLIVYSRNFYDLWIPGNDSKLLQTLTILAVGTVLSSGCIYSLFSIFAVTNKLKMNSIALIVTAVCSISVTFLCLKFTPLGVYAIVGVSSVFGILRNFLFTPIYAAHCLKIPKYTFYPTLLKNVFNIAVLIVVAYFIQKNMVCDSWGQLIKHGIVNLVIDIPITLCIVFNSQQRKYLFDIVKRKVRHG
jgi:O-antigen/teichoic acid export membrane protein